MPEQKTAILVDSGTDVPKAYQEKCPIYVIPLKIVYKDREYNDRVDITPQEIYDRLPYEVPHTSLPDSETILNVFDQIHKDGFDSVIAISISSGLSGTFNVIRLLAKDYKQLNFRLIDTKNIGIGAGMQAILACNLLQNGESMDQVCEKLEANIPHTKTYFCLNTLEYLEKGGRIGKVSALMGSILNIKPIITCNTEGIYTTVAKVRGRAQAIAESISLVVRDANKYTRFAIAVVQGCAMEEAKRVMKELKERLPHCSLFIDSEVSPALSVHTGPGLIGICIQNLPA